MSKIYVINLRLTEKNEAGIVEEHEHKLIYCTLSAEHVREAIKCIIADEIAKREAK